jgi:hypothetical protein
MAMDMLPAYLAEALDHDEHTAMVAHIEQCQQCQTELTTLRHLLRSLAALPLGLMPAPPSVVDAVMARITSAQPSDETLTRSHLNGRSAVSITQEQRNLPGKRAHMTAAIKTPRPSGQASVAAHRPPRLLVAGIALVLLVAFIGVLFLARQGSQQPGRLLLPATTPTLTPLTTSRAAMKLPAGWSAAYSSGSFKAVSASGEKVAVQDLPGVSMSSGPASLSVGISVDGHILAYADTAGRNGDGPVWVENLVTGVIWGPLANATELHWAPDAPILVAGDLNTNNTALSVIDATAKKTRLVRLTLSSSTARIARIVGWIDANHVAVVCVTGKVDLMLGSADLTTGVIKPLASVGTPPDLFISPDGKEIFVAPNFWASTAQLIDTKTGAARALPGITAQFSDQLMHLDNVNLAYGGNWAYQFAWRPGTHTIALSLAGSSIPNEDASQSVTQQPGVWLIDLDHDSASHINQHRYPLAWTPDGQTLFLSDVPPLGHLANSGFMPGPNLYALSPVVNNGHERLLASDMSVFYGLAHS